MHSDFAGTRRVPGNVMDNPRSMVVSVRCSRKKQERMANSNELAPSSPTSTTAVAPMASSSIIFGLQHAPRSHKSIAPGWALFCLSGRIS